MQLSHEGNDKAVRDKYTLEFIDKHVPAGSCPSRCPSEQEEEKSNETNGRKHQTFHRKENVTFTSSLRLSCSSLLKLCDDPSRSATLETHTAYSRSMRDAREGETPSGLVSYYGRTKTMLEIEEEGRHGGGNNTEGGWQGRAGGWSSRGVR